MRPAGLRARRAQVTVELLLVLPVFMLMIFFIMEIGNLAYQTILAHHCAYELARIGSLVAGAKGGDRERMADCSRAKDKMETVLKGQMLPRWKGPPVTIDSAECRYTMNDPQDATGSHMNEDLELVLVYPAPLVFPGSSYLLSDAPRGKRRKNIKVMVRMPIEKPVFQ